MSKQTEALKLALEALETAEDQLAKPYSTAARYAITAIREALAEQPAQQQEPVAWMVDVDLANYQGQSEYRTILAWNAKPVHSGTYEINEVLKAVPLYTSPPASKPWVGLVMGELPEDGHNNDFLRGAAWAEAKLREKNA